MDREETAASPAPKFPSYLLPGVSIPFRKRRQSSQISRSSIDSGEDSSPSFRQGSTYTPSLCTSATGSAQSSPVESPPTPSLWWSKRFSFSHQSVGANPDETRPRLSRTQPNTLRCSTCSSDLAFSSQIVSKGFTGRYGRAYLVAPPSQPPTKSRKAGDLINVKMGKPETRQLVTGSHVVADISCGVCHAKVGWKYVDAKDESQKYKVGKFILETQRVLDYRSWEDVEVPWFDGEEEMEPEPDVRVVDGAEPIVFDSEDEDECEDLFSGTWDPQLVAKRRARKVSARAKQSA
jgi:hypothetical protein